MKCLHLSTNRIVRLQCQQADEVKQSENSWGGREMYVQGSY